MILLNALHWLHITWFDNNITNDLLSFVIIIKNRLILLLLFFLSFLKHVDCLCWCLWRVCSGYLAKQPERLRVNNKGERKKQQQQQRPFLMRWNLQQSYINQHEGLLGEGADCLSSHIDSERSYWRYTTQILFPNEGWVSLIESLTVYLPTYIFNRPATQRCRPHTVHQLKKWASVVDWRGAVLLVAWRIDIISVNL